MSKFRRKRFSRFCRLEKSSSNNNGSPSTSGTCSPGKSRFRGEQWTVHPKGIRNKNELSAHYADIAVNHRQYRPARSYRAATTPRAGRPGAMVGGVSEKLFPG